MQEVSSINNSKIKPVVRLNLIQLHDFDFCLLIVDTRDPID